MKKFEWYEFIDIDFDQVVGNEKEIGTSCPTCCDWRIGKYCHKCGTLLETIERELIPISLMDKCDIDLLGLQWTTHCDNYSLEDSPTFKINFEDLHLLKEKVDKRFNTKKWKDVFKILDLHKAVYKKKYFVSYDGEV